ncbi:MAG TPA: hypothetical protein VIG99_17805 [Myxococcaceae bacterium]|jgi:hypothetical protein
MRLPLLFAAVALAVAGCAPPPPGFARLGSFQLEYFGGGGSESLALFRYDQEANGCQALDQDFSIDLNGAPASFIWRGGSTPTFPFGIARCDSPGAQLPAPLVFGQAVTITATTGGESVVMEIEGVGSTLGAHPILAPGEVVHRGQLVRLAIDPGFDRVQWEGTAEVSVETQQFTRSESVPVAPPSAAGELEVQIPITLPAGPTHILLRPKAHPVNTRCEGIDSCIVPETISVHVDVVVNTVP